MPGGCHPKHQPCGDPNLVPDTGSDDFGQAPTQLSQNLNINLVDLSLVPWMPDGLPDGPNIPSWVRIPAPPVRYANEAMVVTVCCTDTEILNSVSTLVPAGSFHSFTSQAQANATARLYWEPILELELNCTVVTTNVVTGTALGVVTPFVEEQAGGTWLSDPWDGDNYIENEYSC